MPVCCRKIRDHSRGDRRKMSTSDANQNSSQESEGESQLHEELIFKQDLNEVHLLIDFISGRAIRRATRSVDGAAVAVVTCSARAAAAATCSCRRDDVSAASEQPGCCVLSYDGRCNEPAHAGTKLVRGLTNRLARFSLSAALSIGYHGQTGCSRAGSSLDFRLRRLCPGCDTLRRAPPTKRQSRFT